METTEATEQPTPEKFPVLILDDTAKYFLQSAAKWANFLGIVGFILTGLIVLVALFIGSIISMIAKLQPTPMPMGFGGFLTIIYLFIAAFYFFFSLYLYQFGARIKDGILFYNQMQVTAGFEKLKSFFKLWGITTIIIMALYVLIIIGVIIAIPTMHHVMSSGNSVSYSG